MRRLLVIDVHPAVEPEDIVAVYADCPSKGLVPRCAFELVDLDAETLERAADEDIIHGQDDVALLRAARALRGESDNAAIRAAGGADDETA